MGTSASARPARTRLSVDARREQLLELGLRLFSGRSYDEVSIDEIAAEANVSKGLLYHYFGSKRDFYVAIVRRSADHLLERIEPDPEDDPATRLTRGVGAYLAFVEEYGEAYSTLMRSGIGADPEVAGIVERTRITIVDRILEGAGVNEPPPIYRVAIRGWIGMVEGASLDWLDHGGVSRDRLAALLARLALAALDEAQRG